MLWKQHWLYFYIISKLSSLFCEFFKNLSPLLCHFVTYNREYCEWLCRLRQHLQFSDSTCFMRVHVTYRSNSCNLVTHSVIWGSMWPTGQTSNNSVITIRWWRCRLPSDSSLTLPHPNHWLENDFVLLAKIIEYVDHQLSLSLSAH